MNNPLSAYRETRVRTASPGQIILMLYAEAVKSCDGAASLIEQGIREHPENIEQVNKAITRAQDVVTELMAALDFEAGGEIARNLFSLYVFFNKELMEGNIAKDAKRIRAVRTMLDELRMAWTEAVRKAGGVQTQSSVGVNIAG